ncbi:MAG: hypothetical protein M0D57_06040 [Sphingobacteriales bacterium JAD_PAG50586_3]|nr:MAG: hypothetical protein M0D57_06040 [Sphingobacteriales bacterium JAD_PAG50586_3]
MKNLILIIAILASVITVTSCSSKKGSCGAPGITRSSRGGSMSSGPGISRASRGGMGHSPSVSGYKRRGDSMSGPTRQHGKR